MGDKLPDGWRVTVQNSRKGDVRWAYVIDEPGCMPFVSRHIFHSRDTALAAGLEDAHKCASLSGCSCPGPDTCAGPPCWSAQ